MELQRTFAMQGDAPGLIVSSLDWELVQSLNLRHRISYYWRNKQFTEELKSEAYASYRSSNPKSITTPYYLYRLDDRAVGRFWWDDGNVGGSVSGSSHQAIEELAENVKQRLKRYRRPKKAEEIVVRFWYLTSDGPVYRVRNLEAPSWEEVGTNYPGATGATLDRVMAMEDWDPTPGKLMIWRGDPGGGKTYALRALCREWNKWASVSYICDPERMLRDSSAYLLEILTHDVGKNKWHFVIMEDTGELMVPSANAEQGQGLSRLLNTVDGMIGQGLKVMFLITTNEDIKALHPAISRPGRCALDLQFEKFGMLEGTHWLRERGYSGPTLNKKIALADLYRLAGEQPVVEQGRLAKAIGFHVPTSDEEEPLEIAVEEMEVPA